MRSLRLMVEDDLVDYYFRIVGLFERVKRMEDVPEILLWTAKKQIARYDALRVNPKGVSEKQLDAYDKIVRKAKRYFEVF